MQQTINNIEKAIKKELGENHHYVWGEVGFQTTYGELSF